MEFYAFFVVAVVVARKWEWEGCWMEHIHPRVAPKEEEATKQTAKAATQKGCFPTNKKARRRRRKRNEPGRERSEISC